MQNTCKIVHLIGQLGRGGAEKQLFCLTRALQRRDWPQAVVSFNPGGVWEERFTEIGIPLWTIPRHPFKPWRLWQLRRAIQNEQPRILLTWSAYLAVYARWLPTVRKPLTIFNIRSNLTITGFTGKSLPSRELRRYAKALEKSDYAVSNSRLTLQAMREHGVKLPPHEVVRNMVQSRGRARPEEPVPVPRIVAAGSLLPRKAYDVLLHAIGRVVRKGIAFELCLAGSGQERSRLEELAVHLGVNDHVKLLGDVNDVPGLLAGAHLFVHPSKDEGLCNAILEAMAEGLPVVASPVGGNSELVENERSGLLVPVGSDEALAAAMERLIGDAALRGRLGEHGLAHVTQQYSEAGVADQYERVFRNLLAS